MVHLLEVALALVAWTAVETGLEADVELPALVPLLAVVPYLARRALRRSILRGHFRRAALLERPLALVAPALFLVAMAGLGWRATVARWTGSAPSLLDWPGAATLLGIAPFVLYALAAADARARAAPRVMRSDLRALELRGLLGAVAPFTLYLVAAGIVGRFPALAVRVEEVSVWSAAFAATCVGVFLLLLPLGLRFGAATAPLPAGPLRERFDAIARRAGFRCREVLVWRTGGLVANAAVVGLGARLRLVLLSDLLLERLDPRELCAVFAHEIGHARRHHVMVFLAWSLGFLWCADVVSRAVDPAGEAVGVAVIGAALGLWFVGFGWISRRFELDADLYGLELLGDPGGLASALAQLDGGLHGRGGWRHFAPVRRAAFLARAAADPGFARAFRRRLRAITAGGLALLALGTALELSDLVEAWPVERALADQRLGREVQARERVAELAARGAELGPLVARAQGEARAALEVGEAPRALAWLALGGSAGDASQARAARGLELALAGDRAGARAALGDDPDGWWQRIAEAAAGRAQ